MSVIDTASRVLRDEAAAVLSLVDQLDGGFEKAVQLIEQSKGRVVLTGMGKSGHIARKVAATMASTGTPAFFLHPAQESSEADTGLWIPQAGYSGDTLKSELLTNCFSFF